MQEYKLLTPGPVVVPPKALNSFAEPVAHHRTPDFTQILIETQKALRDLLGVSRPVYTLCSTGSGAMEAAVTNFLSRKQKALVIVSGKFGERWAEMLETYEVPCIRREIPWGKSITPEGFRNLLKSHKDIQAVYCQMCETSTGALHPIEEMGLILKEYFPQALFCVDAITGLLTKPLDIEKCKIDVIVAGSQKAFMLPTGLSFLYMSKLAEEKLQNSELPRFYFDLRKEQKALEGNQTYYSTPVSHIKALKTCIEIIQEGGLQNFFQQIQERASATRRAIAALGLEEFPETPAPALTAIKLPDSIDGKKLRLHIEKKYSVVLMGGQDHLAGKILRIGHIGDIDLDYTWSGVEAIAMALEDFGFSCDAKKAKEAFFSSAKMVGKK